MYKCSIVNCEGKLFNPKEPCTLFGLPRHQEELKKWLAAIPAHEVCGTINLDNFRICKRHWPAAILMVKDVGGGYRPGTPPSVFKPLPSPTVAPSPGPAIKKLQTVFNPKTISIQNHMVANRCCIETCKHRYQGSKEVSLYRLPRKLEDEQSWIEVISKHIRKNINRESIRICRLHWPDFTPMVRVRGGTSYPLEPPSIFNPSARLLVVQNQEVERNGRIIEIPGSASKQSTTSQQPISTNNSNNNENQQTNQRRKFSFVWRFFSKPYNTQEQLYADCSICKQAVKTAQAGPTITLNRHLKNVHNLTHESWLMKCNLLKSMPSEQVLARLYCETSINFHELASSDILRALFANAGLDLPIHPKKLHEQFMGQAQLIREQLEAHCLKQKGQSKLFFVSIGKLADGPFVCLNIHTGENVCSLGVLDLEDFSTSKVVSMVKGRLEFYGIDAIKDVVGVITDGVEGMDQVAEQWELHQLCISHAIHNAVRDLMYTKIAPDDDRTRAAQKEDLDDIVYGDASAKQAMKSKPFIDYVIMDHWKELLDKVHAVLRNENKKSSDSVEVYLINYDSLSWEGLYEFFHRFLIMKENQPDTQIDEAGMKQIRDLTEVLTVMKELADNCIAKTATLLEIDDRVLYTLEILAETGSTSGPSLYDSLCRHYLERRNTPLVHLMTFLENHDFLKKPEDDFALPIKRAEIQALAEKLIRKHFPLEIAAPIVEETPPTPAIEAAPSNSVSSSGFQSFEAWRDKKRRKTTDSSIVSNQNPDELLVPVKLAFDEYLYTGVRPKMLNLLHDALAHFPPTSIECEKSFAVLKQVTKKVVSGMPSQRVDDMLISSHYFQYNHKFKMMTEDGS